MRMLSILFLCCIAIAGALADCRLNLQSPYPVVVKRFGSKTAIVKRTISTLNLSINETITFHCPTGVTIYEYNYGNRNDKMKVKRATAEVLCTDEGISLDDRILVQSSQTAAVTCNAPIGQSRTLYESNSSLPGCDMQHALTLVIGYRLQGLAEVKLLGMCYDLAATRLRFTSFLAYSKPNLLVETQAGNELDELHLDNYIGSLSEYLHFASAEEFSTRFANSKHQLGEHFEATHFDFDNLLQDKQQVNQFGEDYKAILRVVWLRSLRTGNWRRWQEALRVASDTNLELRGSQFDVRIGVSGVVKLPQTCNNNNNNTGIQVQQPLLLKGNDDLVLSVPEHIWAHVRSLQPAGSAADEFVIVAHNSPYVSQISLSLSLLIDLSLIALSFSLLRSMLLN